MRDRDCSQRGQLVFWDVMGLTFVPTLEEVLNHGCNSKYAGYGAKDDRVQDLGFHSTFPESTAVEWDKTMYGNAV